MGEVSVWAGGTTAQSGTTAHLERETPYLDGTSALQERQEGNYGGTTAQSRTRSFMI